MNKLSSVGMVLLTMVASLASARCVGDDVMPSPADADAATSDADPRTSPDGSTGRPAEEVDVPLVPARKVDLLFVVDNSASMGDKQALLGSSIGRILRRLTAPSDHAPIADIHLGVISTSLGGMGGDVCGPGNPRGDDGARLRNVRRDGSVVAGAEAGFLSYGPGGIENVGALENAATAIIAGVDQTGCGLEAQLESMYRFLVQPDPPLAVTLKPPGSVVYEGIDATLLAQRKAFLRPDSAVAIVMITDEDDSAVDPRAFSGQAWAFASRVFPGSQVFRGNPQQGATAPRGTSICATSPASPDCRSCAAPCAPDDADCARAKNDVACRTSPLAGQSGPGYDGYFGPGEDELNVRFHEMKRRFGVDPQFPIERYVRGLTNRKVPDRDGEHPGGGPYAHTPTCTNPLFAKTLPATAGEERCRLEEGPRSRELVFFGLIGGVPSTLVSPAPDWTKILGASPETYDRAGIDPHMIQSTTPRPGLGGADLPRGNNGTDPVHGREWNTASSDLQYACTFPLPVPRVCVANDSSCECTPGSTTNPPLCGAGTEQVRAKAYPTPRQLRVARALGERAAVASICAPDPSGGYGPLLEGLATKMSRVLAK